MGATSVASAAHRSALQYCISEIKTAYTRVISTEATWSRSGEISELRLLAHYGCEIPPLRNFVASVGMTLSSVILT